MIEVNTISVRTSFLASAGVYMLVHILLSLGGVRGWGGGGAEKVLKHHYLLNHCLGRERVCLSRRGGKFGQSKTTLPPPILSTLSISTTMASVKCGAFCGLQFVKEASCMYNYPSQGAQRNASSIFECTHHMSTNNKHVNKAI